MMNPIPLDGSPISVQDFFVALGLEADAYTAVEQQQLMQGFLLYLIATVLRQKPELFQELPMYFERFKEECLDIPLRKG